MTGSPPANLPGSRVLAGWWRELKSYHPLTLAVGDLALHRVEGLVREIRPTSLSRLKALLLDFLHSASTANDPPPWERLSIHRAILVRIMHELTDEGLIEPDGEGRWKLMVRGLEALTRRRYGRVQDGWRLFPFLSTPDGECAHFVRILAGPPATTVVPWPDPRFDPKVYRACFTQPLEWKKRFGFPDDIAIPADIESPLDWRQLIVDHPMRVTLAIIQTQKGAVFGFWTESGSWALQSRTPAFHLAESWQGAFPFLESDLGEAQWRCAWQAWCQPRGLPAADVERCSLQLVEHRLVVRAPARLIERLQALRSDALKGEAWLLLGDGYVRRAVLLDVVK